MTGLKIWENRKLLVIGIIVLMLWLAAQLLTPAISNPPVTGRLQAPEAITNIFERACFDCHSNGTRLSWFNKIAPISWMVAADVKEARSRINFSEWDKLTVKDQDALLWEAFNAMLSGKMPLGRYKALHPEANISGKELGLLQNYVQSLSNRRFANDSASMSQRYAAAKELIEFRRMGNKSLVEIPVALNGVSYVIGYRNWQVISCTSRFDNNSMRVIYANPIAVRAIESNNIRSFPNGSVIVKVVWNKIEDDDQNIRTGTLASVQIMIRDENRFSRTGGWGFALFSGQNLVPFGKTAAFETTCYNCHKEFTNDNGLLFNIPLKGSDLDPSEGSSLREMYNAGGQKVISILSNESESTLSILYGNAEARLSSLDNLGRHAAGEQFTLVTWEQIGNPRWYGSNLNGLLKSVETVNLLPTQNEGFRFEYKITNTASLRSACRNSKEEQARIDYIMNRIPSVFPSR